MFVHTENEHESCSEVQCCPHLSETQESHGVELWSQGYSFTFPLFSSSSTSFCSGCPVQQDWTVDRERHVSLKQSRNGICSLSLTRGTDQQYAPASAMLHSAWHDLQLWRLLCASYGDCSNLGLWPHVKAERKSKVKCLFNCQSIPTVERMCSDRIIHLRQIDALVHNKETEWHHSNSPLIGGNWSITPESTLPYFAHVYIQFKNKFKTLSITKNLSIHLLVVPFLCCDYVNYADATFPLQSDVKRHQCQSWTALTMYLSFLGRMHYQVSLFYLPYLTRFYRSGLWYIKMHPLL